jgi:hypothetical protein
MTLRSSAALLFLAGSLSCESFTEVIGPTHYSATFLGANVKPGAVAGPGTGTMTASWDPVDRVLTYTMGYSELGAAATNAHLHGPAGVNGVAEVLIDFENVPEGSEGSLTKGSAGSATGRIDLSLPITPTVSGDSLVKLLQRNQLYVDVHTSANPGGEIRGNLREN